MAVGLPQEQQEQHAGRGQLFQPEGPIVEVEPSSRDNWEKRLVVHHQGRQAALDIVAPPSFSPGLLVLRVVGSPCRLLVGLLLLGDVDTTALLICSSWVYISAARQQLDIHQEAGN